MLFRSPDSELPQGIASHLGRKKLCVGNTRRAGRNVHVLRENGSNQRYGTGYSMGPFYLLVSRGTPVNAVGMGPLGGPST